MDNIMENKIGITVIMPVNLGRSDSSDSKKYIRAVESFRTQTHEVKELIIISDGCINADWFYQQKWFNDPEITLVKVEKRTANWPGELREVGRCLAKYDWITYLDADDVIEPKHLEQINTAINSRTLDEKVLFNMELIVPIPEIATEDYLQHFHITKEIYTELYKEADSVDKVGKVLTGTWSNHSGTWQLTHHNSLSQRWTSSNEPDETQTFIDKIKETETYMQFNASYIICHLNIQQKVIFDV